ncbi:peptidase domain-containing ABC transporter [Magnetofaba australis]|uniref:Putative ABC transporter n=1 Tax=Magnetofaba australis IT-1 TaxID=1434232 RepID=A0A1Y2K1F1_9PROT|nr:ABC transporter transmembrane domain-containing protein [Magnetofaba australis]OSM01779.1 putative ABC transporter [Magnetofaba australis IT-1]
MSVHAFFAKDEWPQQLTPLSVMREVLPYMLITSVVINLLGLALPLTLLQIYDRILPNESFSTLQMLALGVVAAILIESALKMARTYIGGWIGARFEHMASYSAMERMLFTNLADFERAGSGVHLERMESLGTLKDFYAGQGLQVMLDLPFVLVFLIFISHLGGGLVIITLTIFTVFIIAAWLVGKRLKQAIGGRMTADERRLNFIIEVLTGMHSVKSMAMEAQMLRRYERLQEGCANNARQVVMQSATAQGLGSFYSQLTMICVVAVGSTLVINHELTIGGLAACSMLSGRAMGPIQQAVGIWARFQTIRLARDRVSDIFKMRLEFKPGLPEIEPIAGALELRDVEYAFDDHHPPILHGLNIRVEPGEIIGIRGDNGSGKTSLLWLMMGALQATKGEVLVDGQPIQQFDPRSFRDKISYLPQSGVLFQGTLMENITMFRDEYHDAAKAIIQDMGLEEVMAHMPKGYETQIDDGSKESLPKGIRQRITIARALLEQPKIILFDEANAAVDGAGDEILRRVMFSYRGKATLILVTPRPSWLKLTDRVYNLQNGTLTLREDPPPQAKPGGGAPTTPAAQAGAPQPATTTTAKAPAPPSTPPAPAKPAPAKPAQAAAKPPPTAQKEDAASGGKPTAAEAKPAQQTAGDLDSALWSLGLAEQGVDETALANLLNLNDGANGQKQSPPGAAAPTPNTDKPAARSGMKPRGRRMSKEALAQMKQARAEAKQKSADNPTGAPNRTADKGDAS